MPISFASLMSASGLKTGGVAFSVSVDVSQWKGEQLQEAVDNSAEAILMTFAQDTMIIAKSIVHIITGDLARSIKVDRPSEVRDRTEQAKSRDLGHPIPRPEKVGKGRIALAVSGTTFYAVYEELLHPYIEPAFNAAIGLKSRTIGANKLGRL
ncbi:hypothetical protein LCGC14_0648120 [marine sediment metagenome]|uniref:Uncharacterized protein n=1 Tax=marine sediment metagenome TaxID=412755 RepID=A0A0F9R2E5_9ZZZZ